MKAVFRFLIFFVLIASVGGIFFWKAGSKDAGTSHIPSEGLPVLVNFSSDGCYYCTEMEPILEDLKAEYKGKAIIKVVDVNENREEANINGIRVVPTQIFYNSDGEGATRHEGFMSREEIIQVFEEMGVE